MKEEDRSMKKILSIVLALFLLTGTAAMAETAPAQPQYTYDEALADLPTNWNPHQYQTSADGDILDWLSSTFFTFDYNEAQDGYVLEPLMAADYPVDVTADYVGDTWGIKEGDTARAWKVTLRDGVQWQDGTPIVAGDYVTSAKLLLNPATQNHRADTMYSGNMVIVNAESYVKQGTNADTSIRAYMEIAGAADLEAFFAAHGDDPGYVNWSSSFGDTYDFTAKAWTGAAEDAVVDSGLTLKDLYTFYTEGEGGTFITWADEATKKEWALDELFGKYQYPEMPFENVGVQALNDKELVYILTKPLEGFYLYYSMTSTSLVNEALYTKCETTTDGVYHNTYGTSADTTISFGPYILTSFQSDKEYTLEKNPNWFGYSLPENEGLYQATRYRVHCVKEPATRLEMFLNGKLDIFGLDRTYIGEYMASDYTYFSEGDSVFAMVFNPNMEALTANQKSVGENINKTIITVKEFRMAMSMAMNRAEFCLAASPTNAPAFALYSGRIVADPDNGIFYRQTDVAKAAIVNFWGMADDIGPGKLYETVDDAIDSITGYNLEMAKEYFNAAYDKAVADGLMDADDVVEIMIGTPNNTSAFYNGGYDFIVNNYTEAVKGTKLEGKLTFKRDDTLGNGFGDALRNNNVDMLFGVGWTGSTFDPYGLMEVFTSDTYQYDRSWDAKANTIDITIDGVSYTATAWEWQQAISGTEITATKTGTTETAALAFPYSTDAEKAARRIEVLAQMENAILQNYNFIPLMSSSTAQLKGMQVQYHTEDEIFPMARGGIKYMTFNYDDAAWDAFVLEQGGTLNYK